MTRLHAISILVPEYDEAIAFFTGPLGFELAEDLPLGDGKRWVRVSPPGGGASFILARAVGEQQAAIGAQGGGRVWLFLETQDFALSHAAMVAAGVIFEEEPRREAYGTVAVLSANGRL
ncbi:MAG: VOC family protein, partial [Pseudomonadota bacterium]